MAADEAVGELLEAARGDAVIEAASGITAESDALDIAAEAIAARDLADDDNAG